ncbi:hypothetical protein [Streptomyces sp. NPDC048637]|uniref:hypothetical protein n=1 Tax=Streptomyces sp. NPDC048637 TaxID=3155636 RepID=UPI003422405B
MHSARYESALNPDTLTELLTTPTAPRRECHEHENAAPGSRELDRTNSAAESLHWYADGQNSHTVSAAAMDADTWARATHQGHFLLLNLAMGGTFPAGAAGFATPTDATPTDHRTPTPTPTPTDRRTAPQGVTS